MSILYECCRKRGAVSLALLSVCRYQKQIPKLILHIAKRARRAFLISGRDTQKTGKVTMHILYGLKLRNEQPSTLSTTSV